MKTFKTILLTLMGLAVFQTATAQISNVAPNKGNRGQTLPIIISGANGNFTAQGSGTVVWLQQGSFTIGPGSSTANQASSSIQNVTVVNSSTVSADLTIPGSSTLGFYDVWAVSGGTAFVGGSMFEVLQGSVTAVSLKVGGGKPGNTVNEEITWDGIDLAGQTISKMWLSKNGNTISTLYNPTIVLKNTDVTVDIDIPANAASGYWNVNLATNTGEVHMSPASFLIDAAFTVEEDNLTNARIIAYPNPASTILNVMFELENTTNTSIRIVDIQGRTLYNAVMKPGVSQEEIIVSGFSTGLYFVQVMKNEKVLTTQKWMKQ